MRKLIIVLAVMGGVFYWQYFANSTPFDSYTSLDNGDIVITKSTTELTFDDLGDFSADLRVFGNAGMDMDTEKELAPYPLLATPMAENAEVFNKFMCEINSLQNSSLINVIPATSSLLRKFKSMDGGSGDGRSCFNLVGKALYLKEVNPEAKVMMDMRGRLMRGIKQFNSDPERFIYVTELTDIECQ
ncbi:MAG: hypothetical protein KAS94_00280 [Desulfobulbaceae bacterium]|nr:hypothetical protein [Desulfobulbaceae bacterium]